MKSLTEKSKELAFLLRHDNSYDFNLHGWREIDDLTINHGFTIDMLEEIVKTDNKGRYEFNADKTKIRACQGHSVNVDVELKECTPPDTLYHGTATRFLNSIKSEGIKKMSRNYVQLSSDVEVAKSVGKRHGEPFIIEIDTKAMHNAGLKFYLSRNGIWLTEHVDSCYFKNL